MEGPKNASLAIPAARDSELEQLRKRIRDLEHQLSSNETIAAEDFVLMASHELRSPLSALKVTLQLVRHRVTHSADQVPHEWLENRVGRALVQVQRLQLLTDNLLAAADGSLAEQAVTGPPTDLREIAQEVLANFEGELVHRGYQWQLSAARPMPGSWDRNQVMMIVSNLISNAIKYGDNKPLRITVDGDESQALIEVADRGAGIASQDHEKIFQRFTRLRPYDGSSGFGVGLWAVKQLATRMRGNVTLISAPGQGSTFRVTLPRQTQSHRGSGEP